MAHRDSPSRRFRRQEARAFALLVVFGLAMVIALVVAACGALGGVSR